MNELITIIEDEEYEGCFIIIINRYPDCPVRFDPNLTSNNRFKVLDRLEKSMSSSIGMRCKLHLYNDQYEDSVNSSIDIYNLDLFVDNLKNRINVFLVLIDNDCNAIKSTFKLSQEESNELINKLLDINEIIKRGEI